MSKTDLLVSIVLALVGVGVMTGQGFHLNGWVFLFWGLAALVALYGIVSQRRRNAPSLSSGDPLRAAGVDGARPWEEIEPSVQALAALVIHSAMWGLGEGHYRDVTDTVRTLVVGSRLDIPADNKTLGPDPFPGQRKHLVLTYSIGGGAQQKLITGERGRATIPTPN
jgi:hypothetical protein